MVKIQVKISNKPFENNLKQSHKKKKKTHQFKFVNHD